jgi:hypothetical protein
MRSGDCDGCCFGESDPEEAVALCSELQAVTAAVPGPGPGVLALMELGSVGEGPTGTLHDVVPGLVG